MYGKITGMGAVVKGDKSKKTGNPYHGQTIYLTYSKRGVEGLAVKEQFVSFLGMPKPPIFKLHEEVFLDFDDSGFLLEVEVITPGK